LENSFIVHENDLTSGELFESNQSDLTSGELFNVANLI